MKLRLTPRAARNLADIADYLGARSPGAALRVRSAILETLQNLVLLLAVDASNKSQACTRSSLGGIHTWSITRSMTRLTISSSSPSSIPHASTNTPTPDCRRSAGKKLPGHYGQQDLSADAATGRSNIQLPVTTVLFPAGTGFAEQAANRGLGELCGSSDPPPAWEGKLRIISKGEHRRWRTCFSSDYRGR